MVHAVRPIQSVLIMLFFLSVGLLIDLKFIAENIWTVLVVLLVVTPFKTAMNIGIMRLLGETWQRASLQGLTLSQLGEFSFLLAATGLAAGAIGEEESRLVIAVTVLSLTLSPLWLTSARRVHGLASRRYSALIATSGSARIARAEGTYAAQRVTTTTAAKLPAIVAGSAADTPTRKRSRIPVSPNAPAMPSRPANSSARIHQR